MTTESNMQNGREHEVGILAGPLLTFDLEREIQQLLSEERWQSGHTAKTLVKFPNLRVVPRVYSGSMANLRHFINPFSRRKSWNAAFSLAAHL